MNEELKNKLLYLKKGSGIHIKKENRGKFTSYCGGKVTSACIARGKASPNPAIRKRATFAANARKWKHENGGVISMQRGYNMPQIIDYTAFTPSKKRVFEYVDSELKNNGYDYYPRLAILSSIQRESSGNPLAENGKWQGLIQWDANRYRFNSADSTSELISQTKHLINELNDSGWNGNKTLKDQFLTAETLEDANNAFVDGFVRPGDRELEKQIRYDIGIKGLTNNRGRYTAFDSSLLGIPGKFQKGGLVYQPHVVEDTPVLSIDQIRTFPIQPVSIPEVNISGKEQIEEPIVEQEQSIQIPEVKSQIDNTRFQQPVEESKGKIYKSSEKQKFQDDMYNAYLSVLRKRGLDYNTAKEFAKRITTQDILESNWGQSSLSKDFNFGGIKDFSGKGSQKDTIEYVNGIKTTMKQSFRKFKNLDEYVNYKINLIKNNWNVFAYNPEQYYNRLVSGTKKYATDPNYSTKLNKLYNQIW